MVPQMDLKHDIGNYLDPCSMINLKPLQEGLTDNSGLSGVEAGRARHLRGRSRQDLPRLLGLTSL